MRLRVCVSTCHAVKNDKNRSHLQPIFDIRIILSIILSIRLIRDMIRCFNHVFYSLYSPICLLFSLSPAPLSSLSLLSYVFYLFSCLLTMFLLSLSPFDHSKWETGRRFFELTCQPLHDLTDGTVHQYKLITTASAIEFPMRTPSWCIGHQLVCVCVFLLVSWNKCLAVYKNRQSHGELSVICPAGSK